MNKYLCIIVAALILLPCILAGNEKSKTGESKTFDGYTLYSPLMSTTTYLVNMDGEIVHTWQSEYASAFSTYFLDNGHIFRAASKDAGGGMGGGMRGLGGGPVQGGARGFSEGGQSRAGQRVNPQQRDGRPGGRGVGAGGRIQEIDWDGNIIWDFEYYTDTEMPHHDIERMPNGNVLIICYDEKTSEENTAAGRNPRYQTGSLPADCIIEVKPTGKTTGEVVWKWCVWDHLIQDFDPDKPNYGKVSEHPELIDVNYSDRWMNQSTGAAGMNRGSGPGRGMGGGGDWTHFNAVAYNEKLDQIMVCSRTFSEFWIIDHSTTTEEAAGHKSGRYGKGGDLLYRWGNPAAYKSGTKEDQKLFGPHDAQWIHAGYPGEGHVLVFNNGENRQNGRYSSVEELILPMDEKGNYKMEGKAFGPKEPVWSYTDLDDKTKFFARNISGAHRLPNGNTIICEGPSGHLFEVTSEKEIVWEYTYAPESGSAGNRGGGPGGGMRGFGGGGPGSGGQIFRAYRIAADHPGLSGKELALRKVGTEN